MSYRCTLHEQAASRLKVNLEKLGSGISDLPYQHERYSSDIFYSQGSRTIYVGNFDKRTRALAIPTYFGLPLEVKNQVDQLLKLYELDTPRLK